jgi:hypothetical protein
MLDRITKPFLVLKISQRERSQREADTLLAIIV